jgi:hypothetical protein
MVGHSVRIHRAEVRDLEYVDQIFGEFKYTGGDANCQLMFGSTLFEQGRVMMLDHPYARTGGTDDRRVASRERAHKVQGNGAGLLLEPIVEERLPTTGLFGRKNQLDAEPLQQMDHVMQRPRIELIAETGNE